jgi:hypothetical protein
VQGWQFVLRQIERPTPEPYLTHPARSRSDRDQETIQDAKVPRTLHHFSGAGFSLGIEGSFLEPSERSNHRLGVTEGRIIVHIISFDVELKPLFR